MSAGWEADVEELQREIERLRTAVDAAVGGAERLRVPSIAEFVLVGAGQARGACRIPGAPVG